MEVSSPPKRARLSGRQAWRAAAIAVIVIVFSFLALVAYYLWQIKFGDRETLAREFSSPAFTRDASRGDWTPELRDVPDFASYIRPHNPTLGNPDAPVTIIAFIDFECPFCQKSYPIFKQVSETYAPVVRIIFKHFPISAIHPQANAAANAAACASEQKKFWQYYDILFEKKTLDDAALAGLAKNIGLSSERFHTCLSAKKYQINIDEDLSDVAALSILGTPTYLVNGKRVEGVIDARAWDAILLKELQNATLPR